MGHSHSKGWLIGGRVGSWQACRTKPGGVGCMSGHAGALPEYQVKTPPTRSVAQSRAEPDLVGHPGKALT